MDFRDHTIVVTGTASGMGTIIAERFMAQGAAVHGLDISSAPTALARNAAYTHYHCDIGDTAAIAETIDTLPLQVHGLVNGAGVPNGGRFTPESVMAINWFGLQTLTEALLPRIPRLGAVVNIASTAGRDWAANHDALNSLMTLAPNQRETWLGANDSLVGDGYGFSKQAVQYYTMWRAVQLLPSGIRMNAVNPGVTNTGIVDDFRLGLGDGLIDHAISVAGRMAEPQEMAPAVLFLTNHEWSSYLTGVNLNIDHGTNAARLTGQDDPALIWESIGDDHGGKHRSGC